MLYTRLSEDMKKVDALFGRAPRKAVNLYLNKNRSIRNNIKATVGKERYKRVQSLRLVSFPNELKANYDLDGYVMEKILMACGIYPRAFSPWRRYDICINWQDITQCRIDVDGYILESMKVPLTDDRINLNFHCNDISKNKLGQLNQEVFGYQLDIDPCSYQGAVVCKSDENAVHDGEIIDCPIRNNEVDESKVYSILIQNVDGGEAIDFRMPYINGFAGFFYEKRRPLSKRFKNTNSSVRMRCLSDEFSDHELSAIAEFCSHLKAQYGELDVLRDRRNGKLYVVDFAKTPAGPPKGLEAGEREKAIEMMACAFIENICSPLIDKRN